MRIPVLAIVAVSLVWAAETAYEREIREWRAQREAKLKAEDGWLTVVGLHWLQPGTNRVGSNPDFEAPLPASVPANVGTITVQKGKAHFKPAASVSLREMDLKPDTEPNYDILSLGPVKFYVIKREDKLAVRVKDNASAARRQFKGLQWYKVDPQWRIKAKFISLPHTVTFDTEVGVKEQARSPGYVTFQRDGREYKLEPVEDGNELWFVLRDGTSGKTTYAASRFLYTEPPRNGFVDLDFNKAENPPCVFTAYATCPLPPPQNRLALPVTAGEMMYH
jgi:uncharacterized protein (DUF1684 family)